jgi:hypothetical protein
MKLAFCLIIISLFLAVMTASFYERRFLGLPKYKLFDSQPWNKNSTICVQKLEGDFLNYKYKVTKCYLKSELNIGNLGDINEGD